MKISLSLIATACLFQLLVMDTLRSESINGRELVRACEQALSNKFTGTEGMACHWYVTPCDCNTADAQRPRVCLPHAVPDDELARIVIEGIRNRSDLLDMDAAVAANTVLSETYPCTD